MSFTQISSLLTKKQMLMGPISPHHPLNLLKVNLNIKSNIFLPLVTLGGATSYNT
jgi:hypothetical protein